MSSDELYNQEYQSALVKYDEARTKYYNNLLQRNITITDESPDYISYMNTNKKLDEIVEKKLAMMPPSDNDNNTNSADPSDFVTEMKYTAQRLKEERTKSNDMIKRYGVLRGNMIVAEKYAEAERFRQTIWIFICGLIVVFGVKSLIMPNSVTDVFNTILFAIIVFLVVYVTENMGTAPMFIVWVLLTGTIATYIVKHIADRS